MKTARRPVTQIPSNQYYRPNSYLHFHLPPSIDDSLLIDPNAAMYKVSQIDIEP